MANEKRVSTTSTLAAEKKDELSAAEVLQHWSVFLVCSRSKEYSPQNEMISILLEVQSVIRENLPQMIFAEMLTKDAERDKREFLRLAQITTTRLLDQLYKLPVDVTSRFTPLTNSLLSTILFSKDFFFNYFDTNEQAPKLLIEQHRQEAEKPVRKLNEIITNSVALDNCLAEVLSNYLNSIIVETDHRPVTYKVMAYENEMIKLLSAQHCFSSLSVKRILYNTNFNYPGFVMYKFDKFITGINGFTTKAERINFLRSQLKRVNQIPSRINYGFDMCMPSLKEQLGNWITEEIRYCEAGNHTQSSTLPLTETETKINTTLSVAKLGVLIRLLVVDKIIVNPSVAPMLRTVAKTFSTLQREEISYGSLETKYHAPDRNTIGIMKDMLQKWMNILGKL